VGRTRTIKGKGVPEIEDKNGWPGNSLGQWSVELGKALAQRIAPELESDSARARDNSTNALIERYRRGKPPVGTVRYRPYGTATEEPSR